MIDKNFGLDNFKVDNVFIDCFRLAMMPLIKVNLLKLDPLFSNHIVPALVAPIPKFHILLSLGLIRENAELGLARNQGKGVIRILHYHLTER